MRSTSSWQQETRRPQSGLSFWIVLAMAISLAGSWGAPELRAQDSEETGDPATDEGDPPEWRIIPFTLPFGSSDVGNGALANLILSRNAANGHRDTLFVSAAGTDTGLNVLFSKWILQRGANWRFSLEGGIFENPNAPYFERGNELNLPEIEDHLEGRKAVPGNRPANPDVIAGREASVNSRYVNDFLASGDTLVQADELNAGREVLRQKQNRYYGYGVRRQVAKGAIERRLGDTDVFALLGFNGARTRVDALSEAREAGEFFPNSTTLLELERPVGFDATSGPVFSNAAVIGLEYNSLPEERGPHPNAGMRSGVRYEGAGKGTGSHYTFGRVFAYHHHYLELLPDLLRPGGRELVFAHRLFASQTYEDIPFFEERGLGGRRLRGYPGNQFVDRVQAGGGVELRFTAFPASSPDGISVGFLVFGDSGRVGSEWREVDTSGWHYAAGGGVNVIIANRFAIELIGGASRFQRFFTLTIGHTFNLNG